MRARWAGASEASEASEADTPSAPDDDVEGEKKARRGRPKLDALSLMLLMAMVALGALGALDHMARARLDAHDERATPWAGRWLPQRSDCASRAVGPSGDALLLVCEGLNRQALRQQLKPRLEQAPSWVEALLLRDGSGTLRCDRTLARCDDHERLSLAELKRSRLRPRARQLEPSSLAASSRSEHVTP